VNRRRVAVTGVGVVTSPGVGTEAFWKGLTKDPGKGPFAVEDWDPTAWIPRREVRRLDLFSQYARAAAHEALAMAGDHGADPLRSGTCIGTGIGGAIREHRELSLEVQRAELERLQAENATLAAEAATNEQQDGS